MTKLNGGQMLRGGLWMDAPPGDSYRGVRASRKGFLNRLLHLEQKLAQRVMQVDRSDRHVRGHLIAKDYVFQALLEHGQLGEMSLYIEAAFRQNFDVWLGSQTTLPGVNMKPRVTIHDKSELLSRQIETMRPDFWLDLYGGSMGPIAFNLREQLSRSIYPIISLNHGLARSALILQEYLPLLLSRSYACDSLICTSNASRRALLSILEGVTTRLESLTGARLAYAGRCDVIPLCVDTEALHPRDKVPLRQKLAISADSVVLLYVGYLSLMKADLRPIFPVIRELVKNNPDKSIQFILAGSGAETYIESLEESIRVNGLSDAVRIMPRVTDEVKVDLYCASDIFIAPCDSLEESFGLSPVEAMSCGLPQVVADWSGYRETVSHGETGFLVPTYWANCDAEFLCTADIYEPEHDLRAGGQSIGIDTAALYRSVESLIRQPELRRSFSIRSRARAIEQFSYRTLASRYSELFYELHERAVDTPIEIVRVRIDQPRYFENFGHFPTRLIGDNEALELVPKSLNPGDILKGMTLSAHNVTIVDPLVIDMIIGFCSTVSSQSKWTISTLKDALSDQAMSIERVRRHVLFLLKHGVLRCDSSQSH